MTVGELVAALGKYRADLPVLVRGFSQGDPDTWEPNIGPDFVKPYRWPNGSWWVVPADPADDGACPVVSIS